jgi:hypothetical protein
MVLLNLVLEQPSSIDFFVFIFFTGKSVVKLEVNGECSLDSSELVFVETRIETPSLSHCRFWIIYTHTLRRVHAKPAATTNTIRVHPCTFLSCNPSYSCLREFSEFFYPPTHTCAASCVGRYQQSSNQSSSNLYS